VRQRVFHRDYGTCASCGSRERVEAAHIVPPPIEYLLSHNYENDEQLERDASPFYRLENMVLLCRKCHMLLDYPHLLQEFSTRHGREEAAELVMKALIDAGVKLEDLKSGGHKRVMESVIERMFDIYGRDYLEILEELEKARQEHSGQRVRGDATER